jgi:putative ABC transport system substrate-binding protein
LHIRTFQQRALDLRPATTLHPKGAACAISFQAFCSCPTSRLVSDRSRPFAARAQNDRLQASAVLVFPDALFTGARGRLAEIATRHKLPVLYPDRGYVEAGGLMSYGSNRADAYREAGIYAGRILKGDKPSDLPVIQASKFELVINLKTAKALGLDVSPPLLATADEVIE